jgi:hypothetical protein
MVSAAWLENDPYSRRCWLPHKASCCLGAVPSCLLLVNSGFALESVWFVIYSRGCLYKFLPPNTCFLMKVVNYFSSSCSEIVHIIEHLKLIY